MEIILSIIVVNYNSKDALRNCLHSINGQNFNFCYEVKIIDNASDENIKELELIFPNYSFIYNENNIGFAAANNVGIKRAKGKYILLLNP